jgi:hypothetical protein
LAGLCVLVWRSERTWGWLLAGFFWSLLAMTKPVAAWVWIPACAYARFSRTRPGCALLFLIGFTPLLGLWMARNAALTGHWFVATIATDTAARSFAAGIEADRRGVPIEQVQGEIGRRVGELHFFAGRENLERTLCDTRQFVLSEIRTAPVLAVKHAVLGWTRVLVGPGRQRFANVFRAGDSASDWWTPWYSGALMGFVVLAAFGATRQWRGMLLPVLVVVLLLLPLVGPGVNSRYRVPLTPILAILATAGVRSLRKKP